MNWNVVGSLVFQAAVWGASVGLGSWQIHPTSGWKQHVATGAAAALAWLVGKMQLSPMPPPSTPSSR